MSVITKRKTSREEINDDILLKRVKEYFYKEYFTTKNIEYQKLIDDYFYEKWKEVKHFFIYDDSKNYELEELINKTNDEDRELELKLLKFWLAYNRDDIIKFWKVFEYQELYEIIEKSINTHVALYDKVIFEEEEIIFFYKEWKIIKASKTKIISKEDEFNKIKNQIEKNWLSKYYVIDENNYVIKVNPKLKKEINLEINNDDVLKAKFKWLTRQKVFNIMKITNLLNTYIYNKTILKNTENIFTKNKKYTIILNIDEDMIQNNKDYLESSTKKITCKISNTKYKSLSKKFDNILNFFEKSEDKGNKKRKVNKDKDEEKGQEFNFISNGDYITNYKMFKERIFSNQSISIELRNELHQLFKKALPIIWVTISWRQDENTSTITPLFEIYKKTLNEAIWDIIRNHDLSDLIIINKVLNDIEIDFSKLQDKIRNKFDLEIKKVYKKRIDDRIMKYYSSIYAYPIE